MDPVRNPFAPGAGTPPPELAGRSELLDQARTALARVAQGKSAKSLMLIGLRGVGKTVLLNRIQQIAEEMGYKARMLEAHEDKKLPELLLPVLRSILLALNASKNVNEKVKRGLRVLKSFASSIKVKHGDLDRAWPRSGKRDGGFR